MAWSCALIRAGPASDAWTRIGGLGRAPSSGPHVTTTLNGPEPAHPLTHPGPHSTSAAQPVRGPPTKASGTGTGAARSRGPDHAPRPGTNVDSPPSAHSRAPDRSRTVELVFVNDRADTTSRAQHMAAGRSLNSRLVNAAVPVGRPASKRRAAPRQRWGAAPRCAVHGDPPPRGYPAQRDTPRRASRVQQSSRLAHGRQCLG